MTIQNRWVNLRSMDRGINVGSGNGSKLVKDIGVNIDLKMGTESQVWGWGSHSQSSSISLNEKLANLSKAWNWSSSGWCEEIESWLKFSRHHDS